MRHCWVPRALSWAEVLLSELVVGKAYTAILGLEPGADFEIKLGKKVIRLIPVGGSEEESEE